MTDITNTKIDIYITVSNKYGVFWAYLFVLTIDGEVSEKLSAGKFPDNVSRPRGELVATMAALKSIDEKYRDVPVSIYVPSYTYGHIGYNSDHSKSANAKYVSALKRYLCNFKDLYVNKLNKRGKEHSRCYKTINKMRYKDE